MTEQERVKLKRDICFIADHYGKENQLEKTLEELSELRDAIKDYIIAGKDEWDIDIGELFEAIVEETADVFIMLNQIKYLYRIEEDCEEYMQYKVARQLKRIEKEGQNQ